MVNYPQNISRSGYTIYDYIDPRNHELYIPTEILEAILADQLIGLSLEGLPLRTRSKVVKEHICSALGYPVPLSFRKTQPRFPGQNFDVYTQKSMNVQIWNEEVDMDRRYVFLQADEDDTIISVKVITGDILVQYDRTGTLTHKYQARMQNYEDSFCSRTDSPTVLNYISSTHSSLTAVNPNQLPTPTQLLPVDEVFNRLLPIVGRTVRYIDAVQERNRGAEIHSLACQFLGYRYYEDDGSYPDIGNQLLEVKLQTSPTIDLGLHSPEDGQAIARMNGTTFFSQDIRYAIFNGRVINNQVQICNLYVVTGEDFSSYFPLFQGKGTNSKIQLPLPYDFFD